MSIIKTANLGLGDWIANHKVLFYNRTGYQINRGEGAMVDLLDTQSEVDSIVPGVETSVFATLTPVTQAALEESAPIVVCAEDSIADNAVGYCYLCGVIDLFCSDDDVSTTDIDKGDGVTILVSQASTGNTTDTAGSSLTIGGSAFQAWVAGGTGTRRLGVALADARASGTGVGSLIKCIYWGGIPGMGLTDT